MLALGVLAQGGPPVIGQEQPETIDPPTITRTIEFEGSEDAPIFAAHAFAFHGDRVFIADAAAPILHVFVIEEDGSRRVATLEVAGATAIAANQTYLYVATEMRTLQTFDTSSLEPVDTVAINGRIMALKSTTKSDTIWAIGQMRCQQNWRERCLVQKLHLAGEVLEEYGHPRGDEFGATWAGAIAPPGRAYVMGAWDDSLQRFESGQTLPSHALRPDSMVPFTTEIGIPAQTMEDLRNLVNELNLKEHTKVVSIVATEDLILVQHMHRQVEGVFGKNRYVVDAYLHDGTVGFLGQEVPGQLVRGSDGSPVFVDFAPRRSNGTVTAYLTTGH